MLIVTGPGRQSSAQTTIRAAIPPTPTTAPTPPQSLRFAGQISNSEDDVNQTPNGQLVHTGDLWIGSVERPESSYTGLRFTGVQIPPGAQILSMHLEFYLLRDHYDPVDVVVTADAADDSAPFTNDNPPSVRLLPAQQIPEHVQEPWLAGNRYEFDELAPIIQEIVSRPGWQNGNSLSIIMHGAGRPQERRWVGNYDDFLESAPRLVVVYQVL